MLVSGPQLRTSAASGFGGGLQTPEHAAASGSTLSKLGPWVTVCFPWHVLVSRLGPSLSNLLPVWLVVSGRSPQAKTTRQHTF